MSLTLVTGFRAISPPRASNEQRLKAKLPVLHVAYCNVDVPMSQDSLGKEIMPDKMGFNENSQCPLLAFPCVDANRLLNATFNVSHQ
jgi:hypothetical protein